MNQSKLLLSALRNGDFAHPGEVAAINLVMRDIPKNNNQLLLDIGCGLGGTASHLHANGWGKVVGIDIDNDVVLHAKQTYPACTFIQADALSINKKLLGNTFDVIYCFSSFFCFPKQNACLENLASIANDNAELVIFDYSIKTDESIENPFKWSKSVGHFNPIHLQLLTTMLPETGWSLKKTVDISAEFKLWYQELLSNFENRYNTLINQFGKSLVDSMLSGYENLLGLIEAGKIGGIIVYATRAREL